MATPVCLLPSLCPPEAALDRTVESGTFAAEVFTALTIRGRQVPFKVYEESEDLCDRVACPIEKGPVTFTYDKLLPAIAPAVRHEARKSVRETRF